MRVLLWGGIVCVMLAYFVGVDRGYSKNGSIRIEEGIKGSGGFGDSPARIEIRADQMRPDKKGVCNIKTGVTEIGYISLEHLNMLDHFAHRYLKRTDGQWHGDCRLIIDGKEIEGKELH